MVLSFGGQANFGPIHPIKIVWNNSFGKLTIIHISKSTLFFLQRENFVDLLEYCEEHLKVKRVLACFNKSDINPRQGIPRALK
jgi:hypothetical protein